MTTISRSAKALGMAIALVYVGCASTQPASDDTAASGGTPEKATMAFLDAMARGDGDAAVAATSFPLMLDSRCQVTADPAKLRAGITENAPPPGAVKVRVERRLTPGKAPADLAPQWRESLERSFPKFTKEGGCDANVEVLRAQANSGELVYLLAVLNVKGNDIPTLIRVKKTAAGWRVNGFDN